LQVNCAELEVIESSIKMELEPLSNDAKSPKVVAQVEVQVGTAENSRGGSTPTCTEIVVRRQRPKGLPLAILEEIRRRPSLGSK
jgi:hypothetical protein